MTQAAPQRAPGGWDVIAPLPPATVITAAAYVCGVDVHDLLEHGRTRPITLCRELCAAVLRRNLSMSLTRMARELYCTHAAILHALRRFRKLETEPVPYLDGRTRRQLADEVEARADQLAGPRETAHVGCPVCEGLGQVTRERAELLRTMNHARGAAA